MEHKKTNKNSVKLTDKKTKVIKQEIQEENDNSKIVIVSLIIALLVALIAYVQFAKTDEEKEDKKDKVQVVEKQEEEKEEVQDKVEKEEEKYSYVDVAKPVVDNKKEEEISKPVNKPVEEEIYYSITFEVNGGDRLDDQILTSDETTSSVLPEREGWSFAGWYIDKEFSEEFIFGNKLESDITLYAKWSKFVKYVVDGEELDIVNTVSEGEVMPLLTKEDLNLEDDSYEIAWDAKTVDEYDNIIVFEVKEGTIFTEADYGNSDTIILEMVKLAKFELSFYENENSNEALHVQKVVEGREVDFTDVETIIGNKYDEEYEFSWYYLDDAGIKFDFAKGTVANTAITKLYLSDVYEIIYNEKVETEDSEEVVYEEVGKQNVSKDSVITDVLEPEEKEDKTFDGWYIIDEQTKQETDQKLEIGQTIITGNINVVGKWNDVIVDNPEEQIPPVTGENTDEEVQEENEITTEQPEPTTPVEEEQTPSVEEEEKEQEEQPAEPVLETPSEETDEEVTEPVVESSSLEETNE